VRVTFRGARGQSLSATLSLPARAPVAHALFTHCFACAEDSGAMEHLLRGLTGHGLAVLRLDYPAEVGELVAAAGYLRETREAPRLLVGHGLGGTAALRAAVEVPEVRAVATLGAPFAPELVHGLLEPVLREAREKGEAELCLGGRGVRLTRRFLEELAEPRMEEAVRHLDRALLVLHSPMDGVVCLENARRLYETARHPKSFVALDGADHFLSWPEDARFVAAMLGAWAERYVGAPEVEEVERPREAGTELEPDLVEVREAGEGLYAQDVQVGRHRLRVDEPVAYGGGDTGPSPYGLLAAALGACTAMTLRMYARRKQWPLETVRVRLRHTKVHARDCQACETKEGKVDRMERTLVLEGPLDAPQRQRLVEMADRCPVHRTLESEVDLRTSLEEKTG
jgi:uncharacterized OsmC-like protein/fermentation-respiration switch protein FrsA (DUF1100 family)